MKERDAVKLNGGGRVYFCGSYLGYGFHEDGYRSGKMTAQILMENNA
jgi:predicted NAD/FAD-binding protein